MGLVSDGGVHSGWTHIEALIELAAQEGVPDVVVHAFTDGRDTLPTSAPATSSELERWLRHAGRIGTVSGRYYAMDRDKRWERTKLAYDAIVHGAGRAGRERRRGGRGGLRAGRDRRVHPPDGDRRLRRRCADGDVAIHFNFRPDRARQLSMALGEPDFDGFDRGDPPDDRAHDADGVPGEWTYPVAFAPREPEATLAEVLSTGGDAPAARRGDREVRARHLLLQRRPRGGVGGGGAPRWSIRRATSPPTTAAGDERRGRGREFASGGRPAATGSGSSTSPTPTWSVTPASIPAAVSAIETVDALPRRRW